MKLRKAQRNELKAEVASMDGRTRAKRILEGMRSKLNRLADREFDVGFAMLSALLREHNETGAPLDGQRARVAAECGGRLKADNEEWWSMDGFIFGFADDLVPA